MQAGITAASWSVALRMGLAGGLLLAVGRARGVPLAVPGRDRIYVALQGVLFFAAGFIAFYESTQRIPSGLSTLILSTSSIFAALAARLFMGTPLRPSLFVAAGLGLAGIAIVFGPRIANVGPHAVEGVAWAFAAAISTALGTLLGARNQQAGLPALASLGWAALTGAAASIAWAVISGTPYTIDPSARYWLSLAYLAVVATFAAFLVYFDLVRRIGPARAAYALVTVPAVALTLSILFEGLSLDAYLIVGVALILVGNAVVIRGG